MKKFTLALGLIIAASCATTQAATHEHDGAQHQAASQAAAATHQGSGVLKAINAKDGKLQIAHEPIAELGWPAMTMWFALKTHLPQGIKVGDNVRFEMQQNDKKQWVIVKIGSK